MTNSNQYVHSSSFVDGDAQVGSGTRIWHFVHVMSGAQIGENCVIGQGGFVAGGVVIGNGVRIQNNVSLFDGVVLEDDVFCGPSVVFTNVLRPRSFVSRKSEYADTVVRRGATLGANSTIVCGVTIGRYAMIGAGAVVNHDVADYELVAGVPARHLGWVCICGERIELLDDAGRCERCDRVYKLTDNFLVNSPLDGTEAN